MKEKSAVMDHLGHEAGKKKTHKHHTHHLEIKRVDGGGFHMTHHTQDEEGNPGPDHTSIATDADDMGQQAQAAMADQPAAGEGAPPAQAAPPPAAAGAPPGQ